MSTCDKPSSDFCTAIIANPDISGRGVRIALYIQILISMTIPLFLPYHERAFRHSTRNAYVISTSLIIASLIEMKTRGLSLLDALIVTMLTTIMAAFITVNTSYIRNLGLSISIPSFLFTIFWFYWGLQVWHNPSTFGIPSDKENCTANTGTVFVVFGHNISVTNSGLRGFAISVFVIGLARVLASLYYSTATWLDYRKFTMKGATAAKDNVARTFLTGKQIKRTKVYPISGLAIGGLVGMIYMIITTEQIVDRNNVRDQLEDWTYSQTIALILLGQQLFEWGSYWGKEMLDKKKEEEMQKRIREERELREIRSGRARDPLTC